MTPKISKSIAQNFPNFRPAARNSTALGHAYRISVRRGQLQRHRIKCNNNGDVENARHENAGLENVAQKYRAGKCRKGKCGTKSLRVENAGMEKAGKENMESRM